MMMSPQESNFDLRVGQAATLRRGMSDAFKAVSTAHAAYQAILTLYAESGSITREGVNAICHEGRLYADIVAQYCNAVMTWLAYADTILRKPE